LEDCAFSSELALSVGERIRASGEYGIDNDQRE